MEILGYGVRGHKSRCASRVIAGALVLVAAHAASAQTNPAGTATEQAPSEAARRAALSPFRFILQNATAPARKPAAAEPKRPAAPAVQHAAVQPSAPAPTPAPSAPAEVAVPEPTLAALSRAPVEPPAPRLEVIPIRTDQPHLSPALLRERPHGTVMVQFDVQPDGSVSDAKVLSSTNRLLNRPTIDAVQGWKFEPVDAVLTVQTEVAYKLDQ